MMVTALLPSYRSQDSRDSGTTLHPYGMMSSPLGTFNFTEARPTSPFNVTSFDTLNEPLNLFKSVQSLLDSVEVHLERSEIILNDAEALIQRAQMIEDAANEGLMLLDQLINEVPYLGESESGEVVRAKIVEAIDVPLFPEFESDPEDWF